jgi:hypothetical protein
MDEPAHKAGRSQINRLATGVVWCSIAVSGARSGDVDAKRFELRQSRVHHAPMVATTNVMTPNKHQATYLRVDDSIGDVLKHPAFAGFARHQQAGV